MARFRIPEEVPVFPLANCLLFPSTDLPLYIFEPRYRKMLSDTMNSHKLMAISLLKPGWEELKEDTPESHPTVGVGFVRAVFENPDGTSNIVLRGIAKAKILDYKQTKPYRIARIELLEDSIEDNDEISLLSDELRELLIQKMRLSSESPNTPFHLPQEYRDPNILSHVASYLASASPLLKQDLLSTTNINFRMRHVISLLRDEIFPPETFN